MKKNPELWGPRFWDFLYISAICSDEVLEPRAQEMWSYFFTNLDIFLPCVECKINYIKRIKEENLSFKTREDLVKFVNKIHNQLRVSKNKSPISIADAEKYFNRLPDNKIYYGIGICIAILLFFWITDASKTRS